MTNYSFQATVTIMTTENNVTTMSPEVQNKLLGALNLRKTMEYAPVLGFYILMIITGLIGNSFVLYIYKVKLKSNKARTYILSLALLDFLVCCVGIPYHVFDLTHIVTYNYSALCRVLSFLSGAVNLGSVFLLIVVAVDRYLRVCRRTKKQLVDFGDRRACAIAIVFAIIISIPNAILYGNSSVEVEGLTGVECFVDDKFSQFAIAYLGFYILVFILCVVTLVWLYFFIYREIYRNKTIQVAHTAKASTSSTGRRSSSGRRRGRLSCVQGINSDSDNDFDDSRQHEDKLEMDAICEVVSDDDKAKHLPDEATCCLHITNQELSESNETDQSRPLPESDKGSKGGQIQEHLFKKDEVIHGSGATNLESPQLRKKTTLRDTKKNRKHQSVKPINSSALRRHTVQRTKEMSTRKITLMMLTITIVFIVCYLPFIIISLLDSCDDQYWGRMTSSEAILVDFMLRFYLINNMANAIIYSFWDEKFRRECILILKNLFYCLIKK